MSARRKPSSIFFRETLKAGCLAVLLCGVSLRFAAAQEVSGRIASDSGKPLTGAQVTLANPATGDVLYGAVARENGTYRITSPESGRYLFRASFVGYEPFEVRVDIAENEVLRIDATLEATALFQQEVVVTADRGRPQLTPITFSNMPARELEEQPDMKDLPVLLAALPSTTYYSENGNGIGYSTLRIRGFDQRRIAVSINGIPQNDPEDFNVFWINFFDIQEAVEDLQVQRGAGSSFYGPAAIGGAINVVARPYEPFPYAEADFGYGSYDTQRYSIEANSGLIGGRYVGFGRFSRLLSDGYREWSWTEFYRFFVGVARYGSRSTLILQGYGGPQRDGLAFAGISKAANDDKEARRSNFSASTQDVEDFHQPHVELLHDWEISPRVSIHQALFWTKGEGYFDFGGTFRSPDYLRLPQGWGGLSDDERRLPLFLVAPDASLLFRAYLDQWQVGWLPHAVVRSRFGQTKVGAEARLHRSLRWGRMQEAEGLPMDLVGSQNDIRTYSFRAEKTISSAYVSHLARDGNRFAVQGDLQLTYRRYRVYEEDFYGHAFQKPYVFVNPRLGITLRPEQPFSGYASIALAQREPRLKSLYDGEEAGAGFEPRFERRADGSFDYDRALVRPERLLDFEFGASYESGRYRLGANVFWMEFWDEIVPSGGLDQFGVPRTGNAERTRHVGVELEGSAALTDRLSVYGNATLSRNRFVAFTEFVPNGSGRTAAIRRDGNPIAGFPEQVGNLGLRYAVSGFTLRLNVAAAGKQYIDNSAGEGGEAFIVDPYLLVHSSMGYEPSFMNGLRLSVNVNNLLDDRVLLFGNVGAAGPQFFPTATRHAFFSLTYRVR